MVDILVRPENPSDVAGIYALTELAFRDMEHSAGDEQDLINSLRERGALALSLVAIKDNAIVGHVAFSPATHETGVNGWFALGPVSVDPALQKQGIGSLLIKRGLVQLQEMNAKGCILVGHLEYYPRFGFRVMPHLAPEREPGEYFMVLPFGDTPLQGRFAFHPAFYGEP